VRTRLLALLLAVLSENAFTGEVEHRSLILATSLASYTQKAGPANPFPSKLRLEKNPASFSNSSNDPIFGRPEVLISAYDNYLTWDATPFYSTKHYRTNFIFNFYGGTPGTIVSIGADTGLKTEKLKISPGFFLGFADTMEIKRRMTFSLSTGSWFGGKVSETACFDSYDRAYWCPNLTSWEDRPSKKYRPERYFDVSLRLAFN
jgi:hypothetical protein